MIDPLCGSSQTHLGTSMPSGGGYIINVVQTQKAMLEHQLALQARSLHEAQIKAKGDLGRDLALAKLREKQARK